MLTYSAPYTIKADDLDREILLVFKALLLSNHNFRNTNKLCIFNRNNNTLLTVFLILVDWYKNVGRITNRQVYSYKKDIRANFKGSHRKPALFFFHIFRSSQTERHKLKKHLKEGKKDR